MKPLCAAALITATLSATPALAVIESPYQRAAEFAAVIEAAVAVFGVHPIERVEFMGRDLYEVRTRACVLSVDIVETAAEGAPVVMDRREFEVVAGEPVCE